MRHPSALERRLTAILEERGTKNPKTAARKCVEAFEKYYDLAPIRNVRRVDDTVTLLEVRSRTDADVWYEVRINGVISLDNRCTCQANAAGATCWHLRYAWKMIGFLKEAGLL